MRREEFNQNWLFGETGKEKRKITLPHDAMQEQGRSADAPAGNRSGYFLGGRYEYEKHFHVPEEWREKTAFLEFEGVYPSARISVNGSLAGECAYGYNCFRVALNGLAYGEENVVSVEVDNSGQPNSRWYTGAGIYRPVWLLTGEKNHILPDGIRVTTLSTAPARILVETETETGERIGASRECCGRAEEGGAGESGAGKSGVGESGAGKGGAGESGVGKSVAGERKNPGYGGNATPESEKDIKVHIAIFDGDREVAQAWGKRVELEIPGGKPWDAEHPNLYRCEVSLYRGEHLADRESVSFGIRTLEWSSAEGLRVNGTPVLLKGGCIHHDNGILDARSFEASEYRRIRRLKEFGFNAVRSAHNPLCKAALRACDELGMYVMDELWDGWDKPKTEYDYGNVFAEHYQEDILAQVRKDYNHPCVILYSIGNEMTEPARPEGVELGRKIVERVHALDSTRPVTAGVNLTILFMATLEQNPLDGGATPVTEKMDSTAFNKMVTEMGARMTMAAATEPADKAASPILDILDIAGYNYAVSRYEQEGRLHPERIVVGSETYPYEILKTWKQVELYPYLIGDFMWTAWDYLGEAGIGGWSYDPEDMGFEKRYPWLLADTGAFDILGNDNAEAGMAAVAWKAGRDPYIGVCPVNHPGMTAARAIWRGSNALPYWSYAGCGGNDAQVEVYSLAHSVELFINGISRGRQSLAEGRAVFQTVYEPGECRAVAYDAEGKVTGESSLHSAEGKTGIRIRPETEEGIRDNILYLDIALTGENGEVECNCDQRLEIFVSGGELLAFGSARPKTEEGYLSNGCTTYYGRCQAVVRIFGKQISVKVGNERLGMTEREIAL